MLSQIAKGGAPGDVASMLKIKGSLIVQALDDLLYRALGPSAAISPPELSQGEPSLSDQDHVPIDQMRNALRAFNNYKLSIYGGSNEIQKNILAKRMLGL